MYTSRQDRVATVSGAALPQWAGQSVLSVTSLDGREKPGKLYAYTVTLKTRIMRRRCRSTRRALCLPQFAMPARMRP